MQCGLPCRSGAARGDLSGGEFGQVERGGAEALEGGVEVEHAALIGGVKDANGAGGSQAEADGFAASGAFVHQGEDGGGAGDCGVQDGGFAGVQAGDMRLRLGLYDGDPRRRLGGPTAHIAGCLRVAHFCQHDTWHENATE